MGDRELLLVYVTPEMLTRSNKLTDILKDLGNYVGRFVVDEAHCLSQWGYDFRESYLHLRKIRQQFPNIPILACSATATDEVMVDVAQTLGMQNTQVFKSCLNRPNLQYLVCQKRKTKVLDQMVDFIHTNWPNRVPSGIIYCLSRKDTETVAEELKRNHRLNAAYYHADAPPAYRDDIQMKWMRNEIPIIVSTVAFGMGINKPDVEFVFHQTLPKSLEGYYQESGRAGRNGIKSCCVLFYDYGDKIRHEKMLHTEAQRMRLLDMIKYCETIHLCRRTLIEQYFDVNGASSVVCDRGAEMELCDNCASSQDFEWDAYDFTADTRCVVEVVKAVGGKTITLIMLKDMLAGSKSARLKAVLGNLLHHASIGRYAQGQGMYLSGDEILRFLRHLVAIRVLAEEVVTPHVRNAMVVSSVAYLTLGPNKNHGPVYFPRKRKRTQRRQVAPSQVGYLQLNGLTQSQAAELRRRLKVLADDISQRLGLTTSIGCISQLAIDRLVEANPLPRDLIQLALIKGFDQQERIAQYGTHVLDCLQQFLQDFSLMHLAPVYEGNSVQVTNFNGLRPEIPSRPCEAGGYFNGQGF